MLEEARRAHYRERIARRRGSNEKQPWKVDMNQNEGEIIVNASVL